jgi:hypothetical protein
MPWAKLGLIVEPRGQADWIRTHAALPILHAAGERDRVYFSSRDGRNRSHIGYVTLSLQRPAEGQVFSPAPVLGPGRLGTFDDAGATCGCLVADGTCSTRAGRSASASPSTCTPASPSAMTAARASSGSRRGRCWIAARWIPT